MLGAGCILQPALPVLCCWLGAALGSQVSSKPHPARARGEGLRHGTSSRGQRNA